MKVSRKKRMSAANLATQDTVALKDQADYASVVFQLLSWYPGLCGRGSPCLSSLTLRK